MASLIRWEPFSDLVSLRDATNRLFEDSLVRTRAWSSVSGAEAVAVDMYETPESVVVETSLPGVKPEDLGITITGNVLTMRGETKAEEKMEKENYIRQERRCGAFQRTIQLPGSLVTDKAEAEFKDSVLTLTIPRSEEAKPKTIKVEARK